MWRSLVAHLVWDQGAGGSNPLIPTNSYFSAVYSLYLITFVPCGTETWYIMALQHLLKRNGFYYFRIAIPLHLKPKLHRNEIKVSLGTQSLRSAKQKLSGIISQTHQLFEDIERMAKVTKEQADEMIQCYLRDQIESFGFNATNPMSFIWGIQIIQFMQAMALV